MAIALKNKQYDIKLDSNTIIGVMGKYDKFISSFTGKEVYYLDKKISVSKKRVYSLLNIDDSNVIKLIKEYHLDEEFLNKEIRELSHSEQKILKYILLLLSDKKIIVIDEPFIDLDYGYKKKIVLLINRLIKEKKSVIISSMDSDVIYSLCKKVLLINDENYYYGDISSLQNQKLLSKYHVTIPDLVKFVLLVKNKKIKMRFSRDIRDLIKDVYRNVSQK